MIQFQNPPPARFPLTKEEALKRISDKLMLKMMFQPQHGTVSKQYDDQPREDVEMLIEATPLLEESGFVGQQLDMGVMAFIRHPKLGPGFLFIETKPEARIPDPIIVQRDKDYIKNVLGMDMEDSQAENSPRVNRLL